MFVISTPSSCNPKACETVCPAGVNYAELFEHARAEAEQSGVLDTPKRDFIRSLTLRWLFMDLGRLQLLGYAMRFYQQLGFQTLLRKSGVMKFAQCQAIGDLRFPFFAVRHDVGRVQQRRMA